MNKTIRKPTALRQRAKSLPINICAELKPPLLTITTAPETPRKKQRLSVYSPRKTIIQDESPSKNKLINFFGCVDTNP